MDAQVNRQRDAVIRGEANVANAWRVGSKSPGRTAGQNALAGVPIRFYVKDVPNEKMQTELQLLDPTGDVIQTFSTKPDLDRKQKKLNLVAGFNELRWDMRYPGAETFEGLVLWGWWYERPCRCSRDLSSEIDCLKTFFG